MTQPRETLRTHMRHTLLERQALCGSLPGYYQPLKLTEDKAAVTCRRCLARINAASNKKAGVSEA